MKYLSFTIALLFCAHLSQAQIVVRGRVVDKSRINLVKDVQVMSTGGAGTITDSLGRYQMAVQPGDSLYFIYDGKSTPKYAVRTIPDITRFEIAIEKAIPGKYTTLKEVIVTTRSYQQDSLENRQAYAKYFDYQKPGAYISSNPDGGAGLDLDQLINTFRFKRNKRLKRFQTWLEYAEEEKYIDYRFNKIYLKNLTGLSGSPLDSFAKWYRPEYEFLAEMSDWQLGEYVLECYKQFKRLNPSAAILPKQE